MNPHFTDYNSRNEGKVTGFRLQVLGMIEAALSYNLAPKTSVPEALL